MGVEKVGTYKHHVGIRLKLFAHYFALSMKADSSAQRPEKLYRETALILLVGLLAVWFTVATFEPVLVRKTAEATGVTQDIVKATI